MCTSFLWGVVFSLLMHPFTWFYMSKMSAVDPACDARSDGGHQGPLGPNLQGPLPLHRSGAGTESWWKLMVGGWNIFEICATGRNMFATTTVQAAILAVQVQEVVSHIRMFQIPSPPSWLTFQSDGLLENLVMPHPSNDWAWHGAAHHQTFWTTTPLLLDVGMKSVHSY